jgi:hypothetical protein
VSAQLKDKQNWQHSDELAMMFTNTYPKEFYRVLQRYVHSRYREKQGYSVIRQALNGPKAINIPELFRGSKAVYYLAQRLIKQRALKKFQLANESSF